MLQTQSRFKFSEYIHIQSACDNTTCFVRLLDLQLPVIEDTKTEDRKLKSCNTYLHVLPKNKGLIQKPKNLIHHQLLVIDCEKCGFRERKEIIRIGTRTKYVSEERFTCVINGFFNIFLGSRVVNILSFFTTYEKRFGLSVTNN